MKKKKISMNLDKFLKNESIEIKIEDKENGVNSDLNINVNFKMFPVLEEEIKEKDSEKPKRNMALRDRILKERKSEIKNIVDILNNKIDSEKDKIPEIEYEKMKEEVINYILIFKRWLKIRNVIENNQNQNTKLLEKNSKFLMQIQKSKERINLISQTIKESNDLIIFPAHSKKIEDIYLQNELSENAKGLRIQREKEIEQIIKIETQKINKKYFEKLKALNLLQEDEDFKFIIPNWNF